MTKSPIAAAVGIALANGSIMAASPALAQDATAPEVDETLENIIVTGSRIRKDVFTSSTPMDVVDVDQASLQGVANVGELLRRNSAAAGSPQVTDAITTESVENGGAGVNTLSLRNLGANRTLVLINGRRTGPAGTRGGVSSVDLNILPIAALERIEVLKDGASSIYGSDAVAGVVNLITRTDDGATVDAFYSQPDESGGEESRLSISWGESFDRGRFRITGDYRKQETLARGDRDYFNCGNQYIFDQATGQRADVVDPRTGNFKCDDLRWGHIWVYDYGATNIPTGPSGASFLAQFDYDGDLGQFVPGYGAVGGPDDLDQPGNWFPVDYDRNSDAVTNADHPFQDQESLVPENENITIFAEGSLNLGQSAELYAEVLLNRRETYINDYRQFWTFAVNSGNWDYYYGIGSQLTASNGWFGAQFHSPTAITDHSDTWIEVDYQRYVAGLRGEFGNTSWTWDGSISYSQSDGEYTDEQIFDDAISPYEFTSGDDFCEGTVTPVRGVPCLDVNWFSQDLMAGNLTQEERDFFFGVETGSTTYKQMAVDFSATGDVWELPAGTLAMAAGFHYREDEIDDIPGEITLAGNTWGASAAGRTMGEDDTTALFVEFDAPLLADMTGFQNLTLNASARYTDVSSYGDDTTWKLGVNWQIVDSLRLRANRGTSFRTPALFELFLADQTDFGEARWDVCREWGQNLANGTITQTVADNCAADQSSIGGPAGGFAPDYAGTVISPTVFTGGGFGILEAETSVSETIGIIWQPAFADLSVSVDYFDITVTDQVDQIGGSNIISECYESRFGFAFGDSEPLCQLFDRSSSNFGIDNIRDSFLNVAEQTSRGWDYAVRYDTEIGSFGQLGVDVRATQQTENTRAIFEETREDLNGTIGRPEWVGNYSFTFYRGGITVNYGGNYVGSSDSTRLLGSGNGTVLYFNEVYDAVMHTDSVLYHHLSGSYTWDAQGITALFGVANFTDESPPQVTREGGTDAEIDYVGNSVFYSQYDWFGRRYYVNLTWNFR